MMTILLTGGAGFIGSALTRHLVGGTDRLVVNVDKLTYAADLRTLADVAGRSNYRFEQHDICDRRAMREVFERYRPDIVMNLAAETHVDRSIDRAAPFVETNILGTYCLLDTALGYWRAIDAEKRARFRFHQVSTDEVYGALESEGAFTEESPYRPNSPYAASKAAADHLVRAWHRTYGLPTIVTNCSNNYGPFQFPEKLIPLTIINCLLRKPLPVYGTGANVRDWLYVEDHARALFLVASSGRPGRDYAIGGGTQRTNLDVVHAICKAIDDLRPSSRGASAELITFVTDRPGHDFRYAIDGSRAAAELGFAPAVDFDTGLRRTVAWYLEHEAWWRPLVERRYRGERLGLAS